MFKHKSSFRVDYLLAKVDINIGKKLFQYLKKFTLKLCFVLNIKMTFYKI